MRTQRNVKPEGGVITCRLWNSSTERSQIQDYPYFEIELQIQFEKLKHVVQTTQLTGIVKMFTSSFERGDSRVISAHSLWEKAYSITHFQGLQIKVAIISYEIQINILPVSIFPLRRYCRRDHRPCLSFAGWERFRPTLSTSW